MHCSLVSLSKCHHSEVDLSGIPGHELLDYFSSILHGRTALTVRIATTYERDTHLPT